MYEVETNEVAAEQVAHLPAEALAAYAEVRVVLETNPWSGLAYHDRDPEMAMRSRPFGRRGFLVYFIQERERTVRVLSVIWTG